MVKTDIKKIFESLQKQMREKLLSNKKIIGHPVAKGDVSESEWKNLLSRYLPKRYAVGKAFIIDHSGSTSEQIDIVIYDRHYSPFILVQDGCEYVPAECVYAVLEVKPELTLVNLKYAAKKAKSVRVLKRTSAKIIQADGKDFPPKTPPGILSGILTTTGKINKRMTVELSGLDNGDHLNLGCSLAGSYFKITGNNPWKDGKPPHNIEIREGQDGLILFFMNLILELQKMGTVPAIEIEKYIQKI